MAERGINAETRANDQIQVAYDASSNIEYVGNARPSASTANAVWRIKKLAYDASNNITSIKWANGSPAYGNAWDSRTTYTYS